MAATMVDPSVFKHDHTPQKYDHSTWDIAEAISKLGW